MILLNDQSYYQYLQNQSLIIGGLKKTDNRTGTSRMRLRSRIIPRIASQTIHKADLIYKICLAKIREVSKDFM